MTDPWLLVARPVPTAPLRLFCFPYAGGRAAAFQPWAERLAATAEVAAVELPGRGTRLQEPPLPRLASIVEALADAIGPALDRAFAFFGHSMGGLVAFELARELRRRGAPAPAGLFLSAAKPPHEPSRHPPISELPEPELLGKLRDLNGTPKEVLEDRELMQIMLPVLRADLAACEGHSFLPEPPLACPMAVFGGLEDHAVEAERLGSWRGYTTGAFALWMLPGDHFFLHSAQARLLRILSRELDRLPRGAAPTGYRLERPSMGPAAAV